MLRDEKIRVVERQWIVPLTAFSARCIPISCGLFSNPQRLAKSGHFTQVPRASQMSVMGMLRQSRLRLPV
jgi:hypothetical protein